MFTNHYTKDIYEKKVENVGEREKISLKQETAVRRCSSR